MRGHLLVLVGTGILYAGSTAQVIWNIRDAPLSTMGIVGSLSREELIEQASEVLGDKNIRVGTFVAYRSEQDRGRAVAKGGTDCTYERSVSDLKARQLASKARRCPLMSEAVKLGDSIVLRSLDVDCKTAKTVILNGADPTELEVHGTKYNILAITFAPSIRRVSGTDHRVQFFLRTDAEVTEDKTMTVLRYLQKTTRVKELAVAVRNDRWFFTHCDYPVTQFFARQGENIPSKLQYENSKEMVCVALPPWPVRCH